MRSTRGWCSAGQPICALLVLKATRPEAYSTERELNLSATSALIDVFKMMFFIQSGH